MNRHIYYKILSGKNLLWVNVKNLSYLWVKGAIIVGQETEMGQCIKIMPSQTGLNTSDLSYSHTKLELKMFHKNHLNVFFFSIYTSEMQWWVMNKINLCINRQQNFFLKIWSVIQESIDLQCMMNISRHKHCLWV